jgi:hypothetical protein
VTLVFALLAAAPPAVKGPAWARCEARLPELLMELVLADSADANDAVADLVENHGDARAFDLIKAAVKQEGTKMCAEAPPVLRAWYEWDQAPPDDDGNLPVFREQAAFDVWLQQGARRVLDALTAEKRELLALPVDALCQRAMDRVAPGLRALAEPIDDRSRATWKRWTQADIARFFAEACKAEGIGQRHRSALVCYARIRKSGFKLLERMDDCDLSSEPPLDDWVSRVGERYERALAEGALPKR